MELKLERTEIKPTYTLGILYIDDVYFCDTLQSGTTGTTITGGTYNIAFTYYMSLKKLFPILINVPKFGIAPINYGTQNFLDGNIVVGKKSGTTLIDCETTWDSLVVKLQKVDLETEQITIDIT